MPYETDLEVIVTGSAMDPWQIVHIFTMHPGSGSAELNLLSDWVYILEFNYAFEVPHGVDPDFTMDYGIDLVPIPEPATLSLLALGGLAILRRRKP